MAGIPTRSGAPPSPADDKVGLVLGGKYRILRKLGAGGMGSVYEAEHELIGKRVAIKTLNAEFVKEPSVVERFRREARAATAAGNEHIIDVTDLGELPDGSPFLVMEFLEGQDFSGVLESEGALPAGRVARIVRQVCDALGAAHAQGIVHRDLKPENIFLVQRKGDRDFVKVLDFGISKMREAGEGVNKSLTQTGTALGTPHYMSPEQAQGLPITDNRTDIYALGVIMYYALTGYTPFDSQTYVGLVVQILQDQPRALRSYRSDLPEALEALVLRCLAKDPAGRPQTVEALAAELEPFESLSDRAKLIELAGTLPPEAPDAAAPPTQLEGPQGKVRTELGAHTNMRAPVDPYTGSHPEAVASNDTNIGVPAASGSKKGALVAASALVLAIAVGGWFALGQGDHAPVVEASAKAPPSVPAAPAPTPTISAAPTPAPAPVPVPPEEVQVRITVTPLDATISLDGVEFSNPMNAPRPRSLDPVKLHLERDGYEPVDKNIVLDSNQSLDITLKEVPTKHAATSSRAQTPKKPKETSGRDRFRDEF